ncbi:MAG: hypothetical protein DRH26_00580 [Deltaproteobacteria bacterium]|nr:MAG: hypothetical protein DRH26_00580 [Deltaproteobacteria bacterium]
MTSLCNELKEKSIDILIKETFQHIADMKQEAYINLARENARLRQIDSKYFFYNGLIYPKTVSNNTPPKVINLHFSLMDEAEKIENKEVDSGYHQIKNYFVAVITHSYNGLVLKELLPKPLINKLRNKLSIEDFDFVDQGVLGNNAYEPKVITMGNIAMIKNHYAETIILLREILMDKLLLQG